MRDGRCPSLAELFARTQEQLVAEHMAGCLRCQALLAASDQRFELLDEPVQAAQERRPEATAGAVVLVATPATNELVSAVALTRSEDAVSVVPISADVAFATEWDLLLPPDLLGYEAMAEVWNYGSVLSEQVIEQVAALDRKLLTTLAQLAHAAVSSAAVPDGLPVGPPVLADADPRLLFQDAEGERVSAYWEPTLALAGAATLGQLVSHRREELGVPVEELEAVSPQRGWLVDLERDALDVSRVLKAPTLAVLMRRLRITASRRLGRIATWTIERQRQQAGLATGTALARGGPGYHGQHADEQSVDDYVAEFIRELERE